ncbi:hypothetical protein [Streptomyces sp. TRM68367]|uniref:hypothetical protein n=1 Tax=Streptomyces sp. TRM68367 TaxID=2758415 RepID=UPI00165BB480|nr:hypothetical protein [Streptomyces sp. TRM68367]MBC9730714.1 hypothetical protein [Streptomyces sp. TRM68367]
MDTPPEELHTCLDPECRADVRTTIQECAPGLTYMWVADCGHWGFLYRKPQQAEPPAPC